MATTRKLSNFRQYSLACESPLPNQRRKSLKKQLSEDIPDFKDPWFDQSPEIHITLDAKNKKADKNATDRPPPAKLAWGDKVDGNYALNDEVIIKKCKEIKRVPSGNRLTRHASLEKDSILNSKQDLTERLRNKNQNEKENEKTGAKPNLQIYLAHNTQDYSHSLQSDSQTVDTLDKIDDQFIEKSPPKYLQPLVANVGQAKAFQIKKTSTKKPLDSPKVVDSNQKRPNFCRSNTIVVVPLVEKEKQDEAVKEDEQSKLEKVEESNGINVIIRPMTAQSRREKFQKRANSAFHGTSKDQPVINARPPLVRSSSAPSTKPEKSKFLASKRKLKSSKKHSTSPKDGERSPKNLEAKEWKNEGHTGSEIVTMVSLISPSGSENEDGSEDEQKDRPKSVLKKESSIVEKNTVAKDEAAVKDTSKGVSLRKTVKSVSFQQSSIHAIRSFSASFPARRGSMATALTVGNNSGNGANAKTNVHKTQQEKRGTNPGSPDADERVPKRRLVRSNTEETKASPSWQKAATQVGQLAKSKQVQGINSTFTIDIQTKSNNTGVELKPCDSSMKLDLEENVILISPEDNKTTSKTEEEKQKEEPTTPKEKQCWAMYCKMTEKGINVSYDTILRGMLTPTEYRIRRKASIADEINMMVNPPPEESKPVPPE